MNSTSKINVYFHVGISKTGTTFLQHRVFPHFKDIFYVRTTLYKKSIKIIEKNKHSRYLVSREFDQQLEQEVKWFSQKVPDAKPIIVLRRHDSYIASQYRRFVKNGFRGSFNDFFNLDDSGHFKKHDLDFCRQIKILEGHFTHKPLVLIYEDLRANPNQFIKNISKNIKASINLQDVNFNKKHTSYSEKQLKAVIAVGKHINLLKRRVFKNGILHFIWKLFTESIRYTILYTSKLIPEKFFSNKPLISKNELEEVRDFYAKDWEQSLEYSKKN